jgi:pimeloyl-ACP methyl ester carboxylesterase
MEGPRMSLMRAGDSGEPVLLMHGIGSHSGGWRFILNALKPDHRAVAWNAPGYMLTDNLAAESPTSRQYADAAAALLDALGVDRAHVVGSSFGSMIAATLAAFHPERVKTLTLLGASRGQRWLPAEERAKRLAMRDAAAREGALAASEKRWRFLLGTNPDDTTIALTRELQKATHMRGLMQAARASDATDVCEFADRIRARTLFIIGDADQVNPPSITQAIAARVADHRIETLPGIGHLPKLEAPRETAALLRRHFAG